MRLLVCGGRDYGEYRDVSDPADCERVRSQWKRAFAELDAIMVPAFAAGEAEFVLIHDGGPGAAAVADTWARRRNIAVQTLPCDTSGAARLQLE